MTNADQKSNTLYEAVRFLIYFILVAISAVGFYQYYINEIRFSHNYGTYLEWLCVSAEKFANTILEIDRTYTAASITSRITELGTTDGAKISVAFSDGLVLSASLLCAILYWPSNILRKLIGMAIIAAIMVAANITRIAGILWIDLHWPLHFSGGNFFVTLSYVLLAFLLFLVWMKFSGKHPMKNPLYKLW